MSSPQFNHQYYGTQNGHHCATCQCGGSQAFFQWRNQRNVLVSPPTGPSPLLHSRIVPPNDPTSMEVGHHVLPNRTVWFKSVSPRPNRITIKVSSPDRPNLRPSQVSGSLHKRTSSVSTSSLQGLQLERVSSNPEQVASTPLKILTSKYSIDTNQQSTPYSPVQTERRNNDLTVSNIAQYL